MMKNEVETQSSSLSALTVRSERSGLDKKWDKEKPPVLEFLTGILQALDNTIRLPHVNKIRLFLAHSRTRKYNA